MHSLHVHGRGLETHPLYRRQGTAKVLVSESQQSLIMLTGKIIEVYTLHFFLLSNLMILKGNDPTIRNPLNSPDRNIVFRKLTHTESMIPVLAALRQFGLDYMNVTF